MADMKRQVAYKVKIKDIVNASYVVLEGWDPNYIVIDGKKASRINVIGTIIAKENNSLMIDDGSGNIQVRNFEDNKDYAQFNEGDIINVVGKVREYNSEKYIIDEFIKKTDARWLILRKKEIEEYKKLKIGEDAKIVGEPRKQKNPQARKTKDEEDELIKKFNNTQADEDLIIETRKRIEEEEESKTPKTTTQKIIEAIKKIDAGDGAEIDEIIKFVGDCESTIQLMIKKGDIFENRAGRVKIL